MEFKRFAEYLVKIERITSRLEMTDVLAYLFKELDEDEIDKAIYLLQGKLKPNYYGIDFGVGERFVIEAISNATGFSISEVERLYDKLGDLGLVAEETILHRKQQSLAFTPLTLSFVYDTFYTIATASGEGSQKKKILYLTKLFNNAQPIEGKYIARIVLSKLRLGIGEATMLDALAIAVYGSKLAREKVERAYNLCSDLGYVSKVAKQNPKAIEAFNIEPMKPLRPASAERASSAEEIFKRLGKCAVEYKYDGFRMQIHKKGDEVAIFSRKLERMEHMFPDVVEDVKQLKANEIIFEGEALAFNEEKQRFYSFQETMHRRRKYGIEEASKSYPLYVYTFDIMYKDGEDLTLKPFQERRRILETLFPFKRLKRSHFSLAESSEDISRIFNEAVEKALEGIMAKDLNAPYTAGKRGFAWIKLKKGYEAADTIDGLVVGYYFGKGSRAKFGFGGFLIAVYNEDKDRFETIAKVGSGFTEEEMEFFRQELSKLKSPTPFRALFYKTKPDVWVLPKFVVEVAFDEITLSPTHTCFYDENNGKGYALRFPRFVRLREDKDIYEVTTSKEVDELYALQHRIKRR